MSGIVKDRLVWKVPMRLIMDYALKYLLDNSVLPKFRQVDEGTQEWSWACSYDDLENREGLFVEFYIRNKGETIRTIEGADLVEDRRTRRIILGKDAYSALPDENS